MSCASPRPPVQSRSPRATRPPSSRRASVREWNTARSCRTSKVPRLSTSVMSTTIHSTRSARPPGALTWPYRIERGLGDIEDGDPHEEEVEEPIGEHGRPCAHVDDSPVGRRGDRVNELERPAGLALVPAHPGLAPARMDLLPVGLAVDGRHLDARLQDPSPGKARRSLDDGPGWRVRTTGPEVIRREAAISQAYGPAAARLPMASELRG